MCFLLFRIFLFHYRCICTVLYPCLHPHTLRIQCTDSNSKGWCSTASIKPPGISGLHAKFIMSLLLIGAYGGVVLNQGRDLGKILNVCCYRQHQICLRVRCTVGIQCFINFRFTSDIFSCHPGKIINFTNHSESTVLCTFLLDLLYIFLSAYCLCL